MGNRFTDSFGSYQNPPQQNNNQNFMQQVNAFGQDLYGNLSRAGFDIPQQYRGNYQQTAQYMWNNLSQNVQNQVMQKMSQLFGGRR